MLGGWLGGGGFQRGLWNWAKWKIRFAKKIATFNSISIPHVGPLVRFFERGSHYILFVPLNEKDFLVFDENQKCGDRGIERLILNRKIDDDIKKIDDEQIINFYQFFIHNNDLLRTKGISAWNKFEEVLR